MTVKDLQDQLKLAKNKDAKLVFKVGSKDATLVALAEVIVDEKGSTRFPNLGETTNAIAIKVVVPEEVNEIKVVE